MCQLTVAQERQAKVELVKRRMEMSAEDLAKSYKEEIERLMRAVGANNLLLDMTESAEAKMAEELADAEAALKAF